MSLRKIDDWRDALWPAQKKQRVGEKCVRATPTDGTTRTILLEVAEAVRSINVQTIIMLYWGYEDVLCVRDPAKSYVAQFNSIDVVGNDIDCLQLFTGVNNKLRAIRRDAECDVVFDVSEPVKTKTDLNAIPADRVDFMHTCVHEYYGYVLSDIKSRVVKLKHLNKRMDQVQFVHPTKVSDMSATGAFGPPRIAFQSGTSVFVWATSGELLKTIDEATLLAISPCGSRIAVKSNNQVCIHSVETEEKGVTLPIVNAIPFSLHWSLDSKMVVINARDEMSIWYVNGARCFTKRAIRSCIPHVLKAHWLGGNRIAQRLTTLDGKHHEIRVWSCDGQVAIPEFKFYNTRLWWNHHHLYFYFAIANDGVLTLWRCDGTALAQIEMEHPVQKVLWMEDAIRVAVFLLLMEMYVLKSIRPLL